MATGQPARFSVGGLVYEFDTIPSPQERRSRITVYLDHGDGQRFRDRVDLYRFRSREVLAGRIAEHFGREPGEVLGHLAVVLDDCERRSREAPTSSVAVGDLRRRAAEELLQRPRLLDDVAKFMDEQGYVGETKAKKLAYLIATSRLLAKPLSGILLASSGAGKSELLDVVTTLLPAEQVEFASRITRQALFHAEPGSLKHKLVLIDEQAGASDADYAIRTLQSKGFLRLVVAGGDPLVVEGPIALMSGTTSSALNPENLSRCLELPLDDGPEQTRRIQAAQRRGWTGRVARRSSVQAWVDAQRILERGEVVIPYAEELSFPARTTHDRRGNAKLLGLIAAHALLHQRSRERDEQGRIVSTVEDYSVVHDLLVDCVRHAGSGLSPRAARACDHLAECEAAVTRRDLASALGWSYMTAKRALGELLDQELVRIVDPRETPRRYALIGDNNLLGFDVRLTSPSDLG